MFFFIVYLWIAEGPDFLTRQILTTQPETHNQHGKWWSPFESSVLLFLCYLRSCGQPQQPGSPADIQSGHVIMAAALISWPGYTWTHCSSATDKPARWAGQRKMADRATLQILSLSIIFSFSVNPHQPLHLSSPPFFFSVVQISHMAGVLKQLQGLHLIFIKGQNKITFKSLTKTFKQHTFDKQLINITNIISLYRLLAHFSTRNSQMKKWRKCLLAPGWE